MSHIHCKIHLEHPSYAALSEILDDYKTAKDAGRALATELGVSRLRLDGSAVFDGDPPSPVNAWTPVSNRFDEDGMTITPTQPINKL